MGRAVPKEDRGRGQSSSVYMGPIPSGTPMNFPISPTRNTQYSLRDVELLDRQYPRAPGLSHNTQEPPHICRILDPDEGIPIYDDSIADDALYAREREAQRLGGSRAMSQRTNASGGGGFIEHPKGQNECRTHATRSRANSAVIPVSEAGEEWLW